MLPNEKGTVEDFIVEELLKLEWIYVEPQLMNQKRKEEFEQPIVVDDFKAALRKLNSCVELTDADLDFVLTSLKTIPTNVEGIRTFLDRYRNGFVVPLQKEGKERILRIIDFNVITNNSFVVTRQFKIEGLKGNIRPDIVLLVNGIPLVLIECKSPTAGNVDWTDGYRQIKRYEEEAPELFKYVQFSIATDGIKTYYFTNAFTEEGKDKPSIWKDPYPKKPDVSIKIPHQNDLIYTIYGLLERHNLIDVVESFTFVKKEQDKSSKIMARYMQFRAANRIYRRVFKTLTGAENSKFGLIWHWQGSGKTYAMAFAAWKLLNSPYINKPSIFVLVDRKDLEEQIENDFSFIEVPIEKVESVKHLVEILKWGKEGKRGIFLVTIEKFRPREFASLKEKTFEIERENIIVLADEVHRTQYGKFSTMMRSIFKNAFIFGFTGTPLSKMERNTFQKFCPANELYLDRYSMLDALEDGFTVPLSYEARLPEYQLKKQELREFTKFEEDEIKTLSSEEQKAIRKKISVIKTYVKKPKRISIIANDIATHFKDIVEPTGLKALLVTIDREACVLYKNALDKILPANYSEIVMTSAQNEKGVIKTYFERAKTQYATSDIKEMNRKIIESFKTRNEPKILIVTDMLITGFDAPNLWTMYLDKPLKEHRLLQAIARTNRPFQNKKWGLIADYIGMLKELETAFKRFEASDQKDLRVVIRKLETEKEEFKKFLFEALKIFESIKRENTRDSLEQTLNLLIDLDTANKFEVIIKELMNSYEMLRGDPFLRPYLLDYTWLMKIYIAYYKRFRQARVDELKIGELSKKTLKLIQETIDIEELDNSFPTVTIDEEFIENLKKQAHKTTGAPIDLFPPIIVTVRKHPSSLFFINLGKEVERTYEDLRAKKIETKEAIQKILDFSQQIVEWNKEETEIGTDKYPVYEAIKIILPQTEKQKAIAFIGKLQTHLNQKGLLFKNWQEQRDVKRKVKDEVRILFLSEFKENRSKVDGLRDAVVDALEKKQWAQ